jgi:hypothetical protein
MTKPVNPKAASRLRGAFEALGIPWETDGGSAGE